MKAKMLKIAGVKSEKEFYKKYPTEEAFMKAHGKAFKKAQIGAYIGGDKVASPQMLNFQQFKDPYDLAATGQTDAMRQEQAYKQAQLNAQQKQSSNSGGGGFDMGQITSMIGKLGGSGAEGDIASAAASFAKDGKKIRKAQNGLNDCPPGMVWDESMQMCVQDVGYQQQNKFQTNPTLSTGTPTTGPTTGVNPTAAGSGSGEVDVLGQVAKYAGPAGQLYAGFKALQEEKRTLKRARQAEAVSNLTVQAAKTRPEQSKRRYVRPEDALVQPNQVSPSYGTGTNFLAKDGAQIGGNLTEIQNMYNPGDVYSDLGYEPLSESEMIKQYRAGGQFAIGGSVGSSGDPCLDANGNEIPCSEESQLKSLGSSAYNRLSPFYSTVFEAAHKYENPETGMVSPLNSFRAKVKGVLKHPDVLFVKKHDLPNSQSDPYNVGFYTVDQLGNKERTWWPDQWAEPKKEHPGFRDWINTKRIQHEERKAERQGRRHRGGTGCWGSNCTESEMTNAETGGFIPNNYKMQGGGAVPWDQLGNIGSSIGSAATGNNAGGNIGGTIGGTAGAIAGNLILPGVGGMVGKAIGQTLGTITGGILDKNPKRIKKAQEATEKNINTAAFMSAGQNLQNQYSAYVKNGGWVSHDWQPQVITQFGEYDVKHLLKRDPMMDTLRTGGNITQNNIYPQDQYSLGGELKTTWGGYAEPISHNPYMPGSGETVMFRGKSHEESDGNGHTGIGVKYGEGGKLTDYAEFGTKNADADVEVERREPATEMIDPQTGEKNMVVFGNLMIDKTASDHIGDPKAKGKKYKNYVADLAKQEDRQNKIINKTSDKVDNLEVITPFDQLALSSLDAMQIGANMKLKSIAKKKVNASVVQNAINETAEEYGIDADALAKGKIKIDKEAMKQQAKYGSEIFKAQTGTTYTGGSITSYLASIGQPTNMSYRKKLAEENNIKNYRGTAAQNTELLSKLRGSSGKIKFNPATPSDSDVPPELAEAIKKDQEETKTFMNNLPDPAVAAFHSSFKNDIRDILPTAVSYTTPKTEKTKNDKWTDAITAVNSVLPYLRPTDQEALDPGQLYPEMMAAAMNQVEPVQTQLYHPDLASEYDISLQDQLNEVTAQARAAERMAGQNPAAAAAILAQANQAKNKILGEQMRLNQAKKMETYNQNIATLNDAQLKNLAMLDQQMIRQEQAKSNTKAQALEIAKSMTDKIAKNKLENRTLGIYENLYNYRFDKSGRAINMNPLQQFNTMVGGSRTGKTGGLASGYEFTYDSSGNIIGTRKSKSDDDTGRNGKIVRAIKNL